ncbi:MAG: hypothetical protein AVDCRST_MAG68-825, partial [uncultured Gemmatimonadetes bacterium]
GRSQPEPHLRLLPDHRRRRDGEHHPRRRRGDRLPGRPAAPPGARAGGPQGAPQEPVLRAGGAGHAHLRRGQAHPAGAAPRHRVPRRQPLFAQRGGRGAGRVPLPPAPDPGAAGRALPPAAPRSQRRGPLAFGAGRNGHAHRALHPRRAGRGGGPPGARGDSAV